MARMTSEQIEKKIAELAKLKKEVARDEKKKERAARNHRLIQLGLLFEKHGLFETDRGALAGFLEQYKKLITPDNPDFTKWKIAGDQMIAEWEDSRKKRTEEGND